MKLRREGRIPDILWLLEHPPTITWGSAGGQDHLLAGSSEIQRRDVAVIHSERGGDVTFHEPGQLVGYPIISLDVPGGRDLHEYLRCLEDGLILFLSGQGLQAVRMPGRTGVWFEGNPPRKIAAMGVRVKGWITSHGFALNVDNTLEGFAWIVPCGIRGAGVTSLERESGKARMPSWDDLTKNLHLDLETTLGRKLQLVRGDEGLALAKSFSS